MPTVRFLTGAVRIVGVVECFVRPIRGGINCRGASTGCAAARSAFAPLHPWLQFSVPPGPLGTLPGP